MSARKPIRILALCDSPALLEDHPLTGFGRVARNLFQQWLAQGLIQSEQLDVWAIGFDGRGYRSCDYRLLPAGGRDWCTTRRLQQFINLLNTGQYTHVWLLMDLDALATPDFLAAFKGVCRRHGIRSLMYFPVDAPVERDWTAVLANMDMAVTYTEYGRAEVRRAMGKSLYPIEVLPHGVDDVFQPMPDDARARLRDIEFPTAVETVQFCRPNDFLIVSVNKNEWRKDPLRSLEIVRGLIQAGLPAKLVLRMAPQSVMGGCELETAGRQLGLEYGRDWIHAAPLPDGELRQLYCSADLYLTTTMGEGWGLGITEALACGTPVAMPLHTSCGEIGRELVKRGVDGQSFIPLEQEVGRTTFSLNGMPSRLRSRVALGSAIQSIVQWHRGRAPLPRVELNATQREWLSWPRIAGEMFQLLKGEQ